MQFILLQSIIVYLTLSVFMVYTFVLSNRKKNYLYAIFGLLAYGIVFGMRYMVGIDFFNYNLIYNDLEKWGEIDRWLYDYRDIGFYTVTLVIARNSLGSTFYFGFWAVLQLGLILYSFKENKFILPFILFTFMIGCQWLTFSNGLRQISAVCFWILSIKYAVDKKPLKHYLLIVLAASMHNSAWILLPFYPIISHFNEWFKGIVVQLLLVSFSIFIMNLNLVQDTILQFESIIGLLGYSGYVERDLGNFTKEVNLGIGFYFGLVLNIICILMSTKVKKFFDNRYFTSLYNFFIIGIIIKYSFIGSQLMGRINYFFSNIGFLVVAFTLYYGYKNNKYLFFTIVVINVLFFVATIYRGYNNSSLYVFNWQDEYFYIKDILINYQE